MKLSHFGTILKIPSLGNQALAFVVFMNISFHFIIVVELASFHMLIQ
jgi:hypothetical protein